MNPRQSRCILIVAVALIAPFSFVGAMKAVDRPASETTADVSDLRPPNPQTELRHLSKNLKLTRGQRAVVDNILQERSREIRLLLNVKFLSQEHRDALAAQVMEVSDAEIESLLKRKQKRRFDKQSARDYEMR